MLAVPALIRVLTLLPSANTVCTWEQRSDYCKAIVEDKIDVEMIVFKRNALLSPNK
jgi:hypothetical protein